MKAEAEVVGHAARETERHAAAQERQRQTAAEGKEETGSNGTWGELLLMYLIVVGLCAVLAAVITFGVASMI